METYNSFISQFPVQEKPLKKTGFHRHHIIPRSQQTKPDERQVYLTKAQHLWAHLLYDQENKTNTASLLLTASHLKKEDLHSYEDCLPFNDVPESRTGKSTPLSSSAKRKISEKLKGRKVPEEKKKQISETLKGHPVSEETRKKISEKNKGRQLSAKTKEKMSKSRKGKKLSEEHRQKLSEVSKGRVLTEETKKKISKANIGNKKHLGKTLSKESKRKISEAVKGRIPWNKQVIRQYTLDGEFLAGYSSMSEAAEATNITISSISLACSGKIKKCKDYIFVKTQSS